MNTDLIMKIKNSDAQASFIYCLSKHYHDITAQWEHKVKVKRSKAFMEYILTEPVLH